MSTSSQYSPHGSRMPSRQGSLVNPFQSNDARHRQAEELGIGTDPLEMIQSVGTASEEDVSRSTTQISAGSSSFTPEQLAAAMKKATVTE